MPTITSNLLHLMTYELPPIGYIYMPIIINVIPERVIHALVSLYTRIPSSPRGTVTDNLSHHDNCKTYGFLIFNFVLFFVYL